GQVVNPGSEPVRPSVTVVAQTQTVESVAETIPESVPVPGITKSKSEKPAIEAAVMVAIPIVPVPVVPVPVVPIPAMVREGGIAIQVADMIVRERCRLAQVVGAGMVRESRVCGA